MTAGAAASIVLAFGLSVATAARAHPSTRSASSGSTVSEVERSTIARGALSDVEGQQPSPRAGAPVDLTGWWVSVVTEDWRWRMMTPPKGDISSVPLNGAGRTMAEAWDPTRDGSCEAYGAAAIMRMPGRLHISWASDTTLKIEADAGQQTRLLHFDPSRPAPAARTLQGHSIAEWDRPPAPARGPAPPLRWAPLKVLTTNLRAGWLRKNGVPYSEKAVVTEYFLRHSEGDAGEWLTVTTLVDDPTYLTQPFITSSDFKQEPDGSKFAPTPCR